MDFIVEWLLEDETTITDKMVLRTQCTKGSLLLFFFFSFVFSFCYKTFNLTYFKNNKKFNISMNTVTK